MSSNIISSPTQSNLAGTSNSRLGYLPALDGLRALAVLAVLFYHADVLWLPGGFLGVEVFFVVSGFLITSLLLAEYRAKNSVNLLQFWQRRARRLLPALFFLLIAVSVYALLFLPDEVAALRADVVAAFAYVTNWYLVFAEQSYFQEMGRPSLLRHLWSLAVEEQFYLLWPLIFVFLLTRLKSRAAMLLLMLGATASALLMGALYQPDVDPSRIYYGTDTRAAGLLIGAALAFVIKRDTAIQVSLPRRVILDVVGVAALAALVIGALYMSEFDPFLYQGGMLLVSAFTALVIAAAVAPQSPLLSAVLGVGLLRWIGLRSYSLYLWHWPVFMVTRPQLDTVLDGTPLLVLRFALTFALAEISFRLVESPIRNGALGKAWNSWTTSRGVRQWALGAAGVATFAALAVGGYVMANAMLNARPAAEPDYILLTAEDETASAQEFNIVPLPLPDESVANALPSSEEPASEDLSSVSFVMPDGSSNLSPLQAQTPYPEDNWVTAYRSTLTPQTAQAENVSPAPQNPPVKETKPAKRISTCDEKCQVRLELRELKEGVVLTAPARTLTTRATSPAAKPPKIVAPTGANDVPITPAKDAQVFAIGDSVMLGASNYLRKNIAAIDVDAKLGRQVSAALAILQARSDAGLLTPVVIVHMGNNGTFSAAQFDSMMTILKDVPRVVFLTNKVPRKWQGPNNTALVEGVERYPNAVLVDWNTVSSSHPEWFWSDGIHLRPEGAEVYTSMIADVVYKAYQ